MPIINPRIFSITNQKGGVGKTTTAVNLAASLAATKRNILLIDMDPQGNASMGCGVDKHAVDLSLYEVLTDRCDVNDAVQTNLDCLFDLIPSNGDLTAAEIELLSFDEKEFQLSKKLTQLTTRYDFIFIDCPPSLNMLTINALVASQGVLVPIQCEYYALEGLSALMNTIATVAENVNPELKIEGLVRTMYDPRNSLTNDVSEQLSKHFGERVYRTVIPRNVRLAEAPSHGMPALLYDPASKGAKAYLAMAGELLRREGANDAQANQAQSSDNQKEHHGAAEPSPADNAVDQSQSNLANSTTVSGVENDIH